MQNNSSCGVDFEKFLNGEVPLTLKDEWVRIVHNLLYSQCPNYTCRQLHT